MDRTRTHRKCRPTALYDTTSPTILNQPPKISFVTWCYLCYLTCEPESPVYNETRKTGGKFGFVPKTSTDTPRNLKDSTHRLKPQKTCCFLRINLHYNIQSLKIRFVPCAMNQTPPYKMKLETTMIKIVFDPKSSTVITGPTDNVLFSSPCNPLKYLIVTNHV